ncbi:MAG: hypothetical protein U0163_20780 [Gemmatimonadaceae bacterium]
MSIRSTQARRRRAGYSLAEMLLALTITILVFGTAVPFFAFQLRNLTANLGRTEAQMTARYAQNTIDRELRNIGIGVSPMVTSLGITRPQPKVVYAGRFAVTFNTDLVANDTSDVTAVYVDPNVDTLLTVAMETSTPITLPLSAKAYPDFTYRNTDGSRSMAETVSYWASVDSTSGKPDEYVLFRRVNAGTVAVVATGIQVPTGQSLFSYTRIDSSAKIVNVANGSLPVYWDQANSWSDSIRTVTINLTGIFHGRNMHNDTTTMKRVVNSQTALANIGLNQLKSCGDIPLNPGTPSATMVFVSGNKDHVAVTFTRSNDEASGEKDVERYAIFRRVVGQPFIDPIAVIGKGSPTYTYDDFDLEIGTTFEYGVARRAARPRTPRFSSATRSRTSRGTSRCLDWARNLATAGSRAPARASALILTMVFTFALGGLAISAIYMSGSTTILSKLYDRERDYRYAAEWALGIGKSRVMTDTSLHLPDSLYAADHERPVGD